MPNMSYCRFENTAGDVADCLHALNNGEGADSELNEYEKRGKRRLIALCRQIVEISEDDDD